MSKEKEIKKLEGEIEAIENTKVLNDIESYAPFDEIIEENKLRIKELENERL